MTAHELAKKLLEGRNLPVVLSLRCAKGAVISTDPEEQPMPDVSVKQDERWVCIDVWMPDSNFGWKD